MTATPDHITITVDEEALREQVRKVIQSEFIEMGRRLRFAADIFDPGFLQEVMDHNFDLGRKQAQAEFEKGNE